jgi:hypothetical protein
MRGNQRGGAMKKIGSLIPTITNPETMSQQCEFMFVNAHGSTLMKELMIVPNDTFILFAGASGYAAYLENFQSNLILTNGFPTVEEYYNNLFETFFSLEDMSRKNNTYPYSGAYIYTPGDIIHNTLLSFKSYKEQGATSAIFYGYYKLPLTDPRTESDSILADPHSHRTIYSPKTYNIPFVTSAIANGYIPKNIQEQIIVEPSNKEEWDKLITYKDYNKAREEIKKHRYGIQPVFELSYWFVNPEFVMENIIIPYEISHPNNKLDYTLDSETTLSDMLISYPNIRVGSEKKYRFVIVLACRTPDVRLDELGRTDLPQYFNIGSYAALPPNKLNFASKPQKLARRASFSAKQPAEACPVGVGAPPMNLVSVKKAMEDIAPFIKEYSGQEHTFLRLIYESFFKIKPTTTVKILKKKGDLLSYDDNVSLGTFLQAIDEAFQTFPLLESNDPENVERKIRFQNVVQAFQNMTRAYVASAVLNTSIGPKYTFGEHILKQITPAKNTHLIPFNLSHNGEKIESLRKGFQSKLIPTDETLEAIRPVAEELFRVYNEFLKIKSVITEINTKYIRPTKILTEEDLIAIINLGDSYLKMLDIHYKELYEINVKLNQILKTINQLTLRYFGISKIKFTTLYPTFGESEPRIRDFTIREACIDIIKELVNTRNNIAQIESKIKWDMYSYKARASVMKMVYNNIKNVLTDVTSKAHLTQESWDTFAQRQTTLFDFIDTYVKNIAQKSITEETYNSITKELQEIQLYYETYNESFVSKIQSELSKIIVSPKYSEILHKPILTYFPQFKTPYSSNTELTFDQYSTIINKKLSIPIHELSEIVRKIVAKKETFKKAYSTQKQKEASGARPNKSRVATATSPKPKPKTNNTRNRQAKGKQTKGKQTRRNGNRSGNRSGKNGSMNGK